MLQRWLPVVALLSTGCVCVATAPDKTYVCASDADCVEGFACIAGICAASQPGGGSGGSGGSAGGGSAGGSGGSDAGCSCTGACEDCDAGCAPFPRGSATAACGPYLCDGIGGSCPTGCADAGDCASGFACTTGRCVGTAANGAPCGSRLECASGFCADGFCCGAACTAPCDSCDIPGRLGECLPAFQGSVGNPSCGTYACNGTSTACPTSCTDSNDCLAGSMCMTGQCAAKPNGQPCQTAGECQSAKCSDGRCCDTDCAGSCDRCDDPAALGVCTFRPQGNGGNPSCTAYVCTGATPACPTSCTSDGDCSAPYWCNGTSCIAKRTNGATCTSGNQCFSGFCADGLCCNTPCSSGCQACNLGSDAGTCISYAPATDPEMACPGANACAGDGGCQGACTGPAQCEAGALCFNGNCLANLPTGAPCTLAADCMSGICAQGFCCATACGACSACNVAGMQGTCIASPSGTDPNGVCAGGLACAGDGGCRTTCSGSAPCEAGWLCSSGTCVRPAGATCDAGPQCQTGNCIDGTCCTSTCTGACRSCNRPDAGGVCQNTPADTDPDQECAGGLACSGTGSCRTNCMFNGSGCESTHYCDFFGNCIARSANGQNCNTSSDCLSGFCRDGVCCASSCSASCQACDVTGMRGTCVNHAGGTDPDGDCSTAYWCNGDAGCYSSCTDSSVCKPGYGCSATGTCLRLNGQTCSQSSTCLSGLCVEGRCCNAACTGACDSCVLSGQLGTCAVRDAGSPGSPTCYPFVCNGSASCPTTCTSSADCVPGGLCMGGACLKPFGVPCSTGAECASGFCADGMCCLSACAGPCERCFFGLCSATDAGQDLDNECAGGLACNGARMCNATCSSDGDCEGTFYCAAPTCMPKLGTGGGCTASNQCTNNNCVDGFCCNGSCNGACVSCALPGNEGQCRDRPQGTDPEAGCAGGLACNGNGSCRSSCSQPSHCEAGYYCDGGSCQQ